MSKVNLITKIRPDTCPNCNSLRSLELYDLNNNPIRYTVLLDSHNTDKVIDTRKLSHFQCKRCKKVFMINWKNKNIPYPLTDMDKSDFLREFSLKKR